MGIAFFDFDKTLVAGDSGPMFGRFLFQTRRRRIRAQTRGVRRGVASTSHWLRYVPYMTWMGVAAALYKLRAVRRSTLVRLAYRGLRGVPVAPLEDLMASFVEERIPPVIYPEMVEEIRKHLAAGRRCVVVTTGMDALVGQALRHFPSGVEHIGCVLESRGGRLTGRVEGPLYGADKANIMRAYALALDVNLSDCWAYTDHYSDKHMVESVGHAVCVHPAKRLAKLASKQGWRIMQPKRAADTSVS